MKVDGCFLGGFSNPVRRQRVVVVLMFFFFRCQCLEEWEVKSLYVLRGDFVTFVDFLFGDFVSTSSGKLRCANTHKIDKHRR